MSVLNLVKQTQIYFTDSKEYSVFKRSVLGFSFTDLQVVVFSVLLNSRIETAFTRELMMFEVMNVPLYPTLPLAACE